MLCEVDSKFTWEYLFDRHHPGNFRGHVNKALKDTAYPNSAVMRQCTSELPRWFSRITWHSMRCRQGLSLEIVLLVAEQYKGGVSTMIDRQCHLNFIPLFICHR